MGIRKFGVGAALVMAGLVAGYVFGPPLVSAGTNAASDVKIIDRDSSNRVDVSSKHRLLADTEAATTDLGDTFLDVYGLQYVQPNGQAVLANGSNGCSKNTSNATVLAAVNVNLTAESSGITTVTVKDKSTGNIVWETSYDNTQMGNRDGTFDGGVYAAGGYTLTATGSTGSLHCQVIGQDLGAHGAGPQLHAPGR